MRVGSIVAALALILGVAWTASAATPPAAEADVLVERFSFQPPEVTVASGGSVTWTIGSDPEQHTVTPREAGTFEGSGQLFTGDTFTVTFDQPGRFEYFCSLHPNMVGAVEVLLPATPAASAPTRTPAATAEASPGARAGAAQPPPAAEPGSGLPLLAVVTTLGLAVAALVAWLARRRTQA
jgi:plastocyanin